MRPVDYPVSVEILVQLWRSFMELGQLDWVEKAIVDPAVLQSWRRCAIPLDPHAKPRPGRIRDGALDTVLRIQRSLITVATPFMEDVHQFIEGSDCAVLLADSTACVHTIIGDQGVIDALDEAGLAQGTYWSEGQLGTNALDTVLFHPAVAATVLPRFAARLVQSGVELRAEGRTLEILQQDGHEAKVVPAGPDDFDQEWLALILGVKVVPGLDETIDHIHQHSTEHSDGILTNDLANANRFVNEINSAAVFVNASTRFNDGGEFGLGAEVAVSTQKLHARGPMGLEELTTYKWIGFGDGHVR
ncbi:MAG: hypothetical protein WA996_17500 [Candidatus Promineifilaceae bacterium]